LKNVGGDTENAIAFGSCVLDGNQTERILIVRNHTELAVESHNEIETGIGAAGRHHSVDFGQYAVKIFAIGSEAETAYLIANTKIDRHKQDLSVMNERIEKMERAWL
jgi:hypothetical protein